MQKKQKQPKDVKDILMNILIAVLILMAVAIFGYAGFLYVSQDDSVQLELLGMLPILSICGVLLVIFVFCMFMASNALKIKKNQKQRIKELESEGLICFLPAIHIYGLPLAEGVACENHVYGKKIDFCSGTTKVTLDARKITDMSIKSDIEIQQHYVSSVGGAVGGAMLFGPVGALIGGRTKKKTNMKTTLYMIITYKKNDTLDYLCFDVTSCSLDASILVESFRKKNLNRGVHIDL